MHENDDNENEKKRNFFRLETSRNVTRAQRQDFVDSCSTMAGIRKARAKTNVIEIEFESGAMVDVVPVDVAYQSKQRGFE